ncbi:MAG TPA: endolytic transglycosylase MltG [Candidatus Paceibacterota bacterium]|nr:endolytic transglycosylase MltG [Candidatus Paceibacterota bacterium]
MRSGARNFIVEIVVAGIVLAAVVVFVHAMQAPARKEVLVTIPEGSTVYDIDRILAQAGVIRPGDLAQASSAPALEGRLFPDTYYFYASSTADAVVRKMVDDFDAKAGPLLEADGANAGRDLIVASLVQKEVASSTDQRLVAGIIDKRLAAGMYLDIDATICYAKEVAAPASTSGCYPLSADDLRIDSPYNTYTHTGLPPGPIGNPGLAAIEAALDPASSSYWYYLSDPKTGATIYAVTLAEQNANRAKYLGQ